MSNLQKLSRDELHDIQLQVEEAMHNHHEWYKDLMRTITCRLQCDNHDIGENPHIECRFGQWYHQQHPEALVKNRKFIAAGIAHKEMHDLVKRVLIHLSEKGTIPPHEYDEIANSIERFQIEMSSLQHNIEDQLYNFDPLTMAINRLNMLPILNEQQEYCRRKKVSSCIAMVDIDFFKKVNDQYGHAIGDELLAAISSYIIHHLRPTDKVFRYGGEEFLIYIKDVELSDGEKILDNIRKSIAKHSFYLGQPLPIIVKVSCGITELDLNTPIENSIIKADQALYDAKESGRDKVSTWNPSMKKSAHQN